MLCICMVLSLEFLTYFSQVVSRAMQCLQCPGRILDPSALVLLLAGEYITATSEAMQLTCNSPVL